jgi:hypothetical protein
MRSKSDFWLVLHQLAGELQREADNDDDRIMQLTEIHSALPPATRMVNCDDLEFVTDVLTRLSDQCRSSLVGYVE